MSILNTTNNYDSRRCWGPSWAEEKEHGNSFLINWMSNLQSCRRNIAVNNNHLRDVLKNKKNLTSGRNEDVKQRRERECEDGRERNFEKPLARPIIPTNVNKQTFLTFFMTFRMGRRKKKSFIIRLLVCCSQTAQCIFISLRACVINYIGEQREIWHNEMFRCIFFVHLKDRKIWKWSWLSFWSFRPWSCSSCAHASSEFNRSEFYDRPDVVPLVGLVGTPWTYLSGFRSMPDTSARLV